MKLCPGFVLLLSLSRVINNVSGGELSWKSRGIIVSKRASENLMAHRFRKLGQKRERSGEVVWLGRWPVHVFEILPRLGVKDVRDDKLLST